MTQHTDEERDLILCITRTKECKPDAAKRAAGLTGRTYEILSDEEIKKEIKKYDLPDFGVDEFIVKAVEGIIAIVRKAQAEHSRQYWEAQVKAAEERDGSIVRISGFRTEPTMNAECKEAVWTQGSSCKDCSITCYRAGWTKQQATKDNAVRVAQPVGMKLTRIAISRR